MQFLSLMFGKRKNIAHTMHISNVFCKENVKQIQLHTQVLNDAILFTVWKAQNIVQMVHKTKDIAHPHSGLKGGC